MANVNYPPGLSRNADKLEFVIELIEYAREQYNAVGKWFREGINQGEYNQLDDKIKAKYPYVAQLSEADWQDFQETIYREVESAVFVQRGLQMKAIQAVRPNGVNFSSIEGV